MSITNTIAALIGSISVDREREGLGRTPADTESLSPKRDGDSCRRRFARSIGHLSLRRVDGEPKHAHQDGATLAIDAATPVSSLRLSVMDSTLAAQPRTFLLHRKDSAAALSELGKTGL